ncbi:CD1375 family protein [Paenibacillus sp. Cedars]|nr:CD1375 family protein [Paenibacillus sp. Cedars]
MIGVYVNMILKGVIQIDNVPEACREDVRHALEA